MAITVTHTAVATAADDPEAEINKAEWNAGHTLAGLGTAAESDAGDFATAAHGHTSLAGANGGAAVAGGDITIAGGTGDAGNDDAASITIGGGSGDGSAGTIEVTSGGDTWTLTQPAAGTPVAAIVDPGTTWASETAYSMGDRIGVTITSVVFVYEAKDPGTTDGAEPTWAFNSDLPVPLVVDGSLTWGVIGRVGSPDPDAPGSAFVSVADKVAMVGDLANMRATTIATVTGDTQVTIESPGDIYIEADGGDTALYLTGGVVSAVSNGVEFTIKQAAYCNPASTTAGDIATALIAAGLMASS